MFEVNIEAIRKYIDDSGLKQKTIAEKSNLGEAKLCLVLQGKRKLEAGEYANICKALNVSMSKFMIKCSRLPDKEVK